MEHKSNFDGLVSGLRQDEKRALLEKIELQNVLTSEPLIDESKLTAPEKPEERYRRLPLILRIWYKLIGVLTGKTALEMYINAIVAAEGRRIHENFPGMYDYCENLLKSAFRREVQNLKTAARFFYTALDSSVNRNKGAFFGYLASLKIPDTHTELSAAADPETTHTEHPELSEVKLRPCALERVETLLNKIPENARQAMYDDSRVLFIIKALSSFLYDRVIMAFTQHGDDTSAVCPVNLVRSQLIELANILCSFNNVPSMDLFSALFMFGMAEQRGDDGFDEEGALQKFLQRAEKSIAVIRAFNKNVPLIPTIRCSGRDFNWEPVAFSGGEEWFSTYKNYWIEQTNKNFAQWIQERRLTQLMQTFISFFSGAPLLPIEHAWSNENEDGIPVEGALNLSFLLTFHKLIFMPDINTVIRPILVDGEFYKKENKTEFLEAYNIIIKLDDIIKDFNKNLATGGEYGKLWMQIEGDMLALSVKRRKIQALMDEVNTTSGRISTDAKSALVSMQNVLTGIVNRGTNPKYDTLSNFAKLAGKGTTYTDAINKSINTINKAVNIIEDINETERMEGID